MDQKQQIAARLKEANNILVTVSNNPSVDQLSSCIGLTLALNKMGKHATAVFSGAVPSTIEFLQPEKTLEKTTDSLRDFIIALDKSKADKLRYKVEDSIVKIFITPYRTSISQSDLDFSQGDFNVDVVLALGVRSQTDLDQAITSHGRILHDATVATVNLQPGGEFGSMNWLEQRASSLCELAYELVEILDKKLVDTQIATAMLTGIVAETHRFSNEKTSPNTMSVAAELMAAGANQQLVATKLDELAKPVEARLADVRKGDQPADGSAKEPPKAEDGTLEIAHVDADKPKEEAQKAPEEPAKTEPKEDGDKTVEAKSDVLNLNDSKDSQTPQILIDEQGSLKNISEVGSEDADKSAGTTDPTQHMEGSRMILHPPTLGGQMSASGSTDDEFSSTDPLSLPSPNASAGSSPFDPPASAATAAATMPFMPPSMTPSGSGPAASTDPLGAPGDSSSPSTASSPTMPPDNPPADEPPAAVSQDTPLPSLTPPPAPAASQTLSDIEQGVNSPHAQATDPIAAPASAATPPTQAPTDSSAPEPASDELASAREAVMNAIATHPAPAAEPIAALNAQPLGDPLRDTASMAQPAPTDSPQTFSPAQPAITNPSFPGASPPPPVPPPMMPQQ